MAVTLYVGDETEAVSRRLIAAGIIVDYRPGSGIRVGAHFFNTVDLNSEMRDVFDVANRQNTSIYPVDPRGLVASLASL